jgi:hypothetical protein
MYEVKVYKMNEMEKLEHQQTIPAINTSNENQARIGRGRVKRQRSRAKRGGGL